MKKPSNYDLKKWLCDNSIKGLIVHYRQTGVDSATTYWELIPTQGKNKTVEDDEVQCLVDIKPWWAGLLKVNEEVSNEIKEYEEFIKNNLKELKEYERLKKKFN